MLNLASLREQVYQHLRQEIHSGKLRPGSLIKLDALSKELGISKTPLKEAIIKLEYEGFVESLPRRGIVVKRLTVQEIRDYYEILGSLESSVVLAVFDRFEESHVAHMKLSNLEQEKALEVEDFDTYYQLNLAFHDIFLSLSSNLTLRQFVIPFKQRLYDFPRRRYWKEWEQINLEEHRKFIRCIEQGDREGAAKVIKDEHWGWKVHEQYFVQFYNLQALSTAPEESAQSFTQAGAVR